MPDDHKIFDGYMTEDELSVTLNKTKRTLRKWRAERTGPPFAKVAHDIIIYPTDGVKTWVK